MWVREISQGKHGKTMIAVTHGGKSCARHCLPGLVGFYLDPEKNKLLFMMAQSEKLALDARAYQVRNAVFQSALTVTYKPGDCDKSYYEVFNAEIKRATSMIAQQRGDLEDAVFQAELRKKDQKQAAPFVGVSA